MEKFLCESYEEDGYVKGYVDGADNLKKFEECLRLECGQKYVTRSTSQKNKIKRFQFQHNIDGFPCENSGVPFTVEDLIHKDCVFGSDYKKLKDKKPQIDPDDNHSGKTKKTRQVLKPTNKKDCPAQMKIRKLKMYPDYKLNKKGLTIYKFRQKKTKILSKLRSDVAAGKVNFIERYYISVPTESVHKNHKLKGLTDHLAMPLERCVIDKIHELVSNGVYRVCDIKAKLREYSIKKYTDKTLIPNFNDQGFFPSDKNLRNHVLSAKSSLRKKSDTFPSPQKDGQCVNNNSNFEISESTYAANTLCSISESTDAKDPVCDIYAANTLCSISESTDIKVPVCDFSESTKTTDTVHCKLEVPVPSSTTYPSAADDTGDDYIEATEDFSSTMYPNENSIRNMMDRCVLSLKKAIKAAYLCPNEEALTIANQLANDISKFLASASESDDTVSTKSPPRKKTTKRKISDKTDSQSVKKSKGSHFTQSHPQQVRNSACLTKKTFETPMSSVSTTSETSATSHSLPVVDIATASSLSDFSAATGYSSWMENVAAVLSEHCEAGQYSLSTQSAPTTYSLIKQNVPTAKTSLNQSDAVQFSLSKSSTQFSEEGTSAVTFTLDPSTQQSLADDHSAEVSHEVIIYIEDPT